MSAEPNEIVVDIKQLKQVDQVYSKLIAAFPRWRVSDEPSSSCSLKIYPIDTSIPLKIRNKTIKRMAMQFLIFLLSAYEYRVYHSGNHDDPCSNESFQRFKTFVQSYLENTFCYLVSKCTDFDQNGPTKFAYLVRDPTKQQGVPDIPQMYRASSNTPLEPINVPKMAEVEEAMKTIADVFSAESYYGKTLKEFALAPTNETSNAYDRLERMQSFSKILYAVLTPAMNTTVTLKLGTQNGTLENLNQVTNFAKINLDDATISESHSIGDKRVLLEQGTWHKFVTTIDTLIQENQSLLRTIESRPSYIDALTDNNANQNTSQYILGAVIEARLRTIIVRIAPIFSPDPAKAYHRLADDDVLMDVAKAIPEFQNIYTYVRLRFDETYLGESKNNKLNEAFNFDDNPTSGIYLDSSETVIGMHYRGDKGDNPSNYVFGPFTRVFTKKKFETTKSVADNMTGIRNRLNEGKIVFMLGYGPSGAGKTSLLVQLNKDSGPEPGLVSNICIDFVKGGQLRMRSLEAYQQGNEPVYDLKEPEIGTVDQIMTKVVDVIDLPQYRQVAPTPNNDRSSRSHVLVHIEFLDSDGNDRTDIGSIVLGDYAGYENPFECFKENPPDIGLLTRFKIDHYIDQKIIDEKCRLGNEKSPGQLQDALNALQALKEDLKVGSKDDSKEISMEQLNEMYAEVESRKVFANDNDELSSLKTKIKERLKTLHIEPFNTANPAANMFPIALINHIIINNETFPTDFSRWDVKKVSENLDETEKQQCIDHKKKNAPLLASCSYSTYNRNYEITLDYPPSIFTPDDNDDDAAFKSVMNSAQEKIDANEKDYGVKTQKKKKKNAPESINQDDEKKIIPLVGLIKAIAETLKDKRAASANAPQQFESLDLIKKCYDTILAQCYVRQVEGIFIRKSLNDMQSFIRSVLKSKNESQAPMLIPPTFDKCKRTMFLGDLPKDVQDPYSSLPTISQSVSKLFEKKLQPLKDNIVFCIVCVINTSHYQQSGYPVVVQPYISTYDAKVALSKGYDAFMTDIEQFKAFIKPMEQVPSEADHLTKSQHLVEYYGQINEQDNRNASSTFGVLEFVDNISKLGIASSVCEVKDIKTHDDFIQSGVSSKDILKMIPMDLPAPKPKT